MRDQDSLPEKPAQPRKIILRTFTSFKDANRYRSAVGKLDDSSILRANMLPEKVTGGYRVQVELSADFDADKFLEWWLNYHHFNPQKPE